MGRGESGLHVEGSLRGQFRRGASTKGYKTPIMEWSNR